MRANRVKAPVYQRPRVARAIRGQRHAVPDRQRPKASRKALRWHNWLLEEYPF
jgi:hypothetical protein